MRHGIIELPCPRCKKEQYLGEFGLLGEPYFTEEALSGFRCYNCGSWLRVSYDIKLVIAKDKEAKDRERAAKRGGDKLGTKEV